MDKRIVSLFPSCTEIICKLGYRKHLVGISHECDYPNSISNLPVLTRAKLSSKGTSTKINQNLTDADFDPERIAEKRSLLNKKPGLKADDDKRQQQKQSLNSQKLFFHIDQL